MQHRTLTAIVAWLALAPVAVADGAAAVAAPRDASEVWEGMLSGRSRYFVVDVRPAEDYAQGHVPGAINLPIDMLFSPAGVAKLPPRDMPLVLVCQSGHTESMALGGLVALGYEPWVMRFGMIGWNAETKVKAGSPLQDGDTVHGVGGPIEK
jgi:rhodanese-related sulfurtransferase